MADDAPDAGDAARDPGGVARAAVVAFWLLNVPVGMWLARGYYQAAELSDAALAGKAMGLWLLAAGVAVVLAPGLLGALVLLWRRWRRVAAAWMAAWCVAAQVTLLADSTLYGLMRLHLTHPNALATLREPTAPMTVGVGPVTQGWAVAAIGFLVCLEVVGLAALWLAARRTRGFARLRAGVRRLPLAVRLGLVGIIVLPPLAAAVAEPRGPMLEVGRHFLIPFVPAARPRSGLLDQLNDALRDVAAARRQPVGGPALPAMRVPTEVRPRARPSILFLCIESLRRDVVTRETMPHLAALEHECVVARSHYAEGNTTYHCVYAALSGMHPLWYGRARIERARPAPLEVLRAAGYRLHALASAELEWVGMHHTVLQRPLFATYEQLLGDPVEGDRLVCEHLLRIARAADAPFLAFAILNATHFHYFYPPDEEHFRPTVMPGFNPLFPGTLGDHRDELWNRYRNAARYVDRLAGELVAALRRDGLLDKLILVIAADHGESFLEDGVLCHANSFHDVQVRIPFVVRYPGGRGREVAGLTQDADLFPSLFAEMGLSSAASALPGFRTLRPQPDEHRPWAVCAMAAPHTPVDYLLVTPDLRCRFWLNTEPDGDVLLEATALTARSGAPLPPATERDAARRVADSLAAWLDRQGFANAPVQ